MRILVKDLVKTEVDKLVGEKVWNWSRAILVFPTILLGELRHLLCRPLSSCKADWYKLLISLSSTGRSDFQQIGFSKVLTKQLLQYPTASGEDNATEAKKRKFLMPSVPVSVCCCF